MADHTQRNDQSTEANDTERGGNPRSAGSEAQRMKEQGVNMSPRQVRETAEVNQELRHTNPMDPDFASEAGRKGGLTGAGGEAVKEKYIDSWRDSGNDENERGGNNQR